MTNMSKVQRAASLVEVLVVLAIIAVTMVLASQLTIRALLRIKHDEVLEYVNGLVLETLEIAKNPEEVILTGPDVEDQVEGSYYLDQSSDTAVLRQFSPSVAPISSCEPNSLFNVDVSASFPTAPVPIVCVQVIVQLSEDTENESYLLTSHSYYVLVGTQESVSVIGYRRSPFTAQNSL